MVSLSDQRFVDAECEYIEWTTVVKSDSIKCLNGHWRFFSGMQLIGFSGMHADCGLRLGRGPPVPGSLCAYYEVG